MIKKNYLFPFILVTSLFFLWAFLHNTDPILIPHLKKACQLTDLQSSFIDTAVYLGYFIIAIPAGLYMEKHGYKKGIIVGLVLYAVGAYLFIPAASTRSYAFFLGALFVIASGATFLETVANPYVTILGDKNTAEQRLNFAQSFNGLGAFISPIIGGKFILSGIEHTPAELKAMSATQLNNYLQSEADTIKAPYFIIGTAVVVLIILFLTTKLPDVQPGSDDGAHTAPVKFSLKVLRHPHLLWSIVAQFFYVGAQVGVLSFFIRYSKFVAKMAEKPAAVLLSMSLVGFMCGRFIGTVLMRYISPARLLSIFAAMCVLLVFVAILLKGDVALYAIVPVPFFMSIMYPTIFALGIKGLGGETKIASSFIVMSIIGGAFAPPIMGLISDKTNSIQVAYIVPLLCFVVVLYYGLKGHRIRPNETVAENEQLSVIA